MFNLSIPKSANKYGQQFYKECVLYRDATSDIVFEACFSDSKINNDVDARSKAICDFTKEVAEVEVAIEVVDTEVWQVVL